MTITIRPADARDLKFIIEGYFKVNQNMPMGREDMLSAERIHQDILCDNPKAFIDIAEYNREQAGFIFYSTVYFASIGQVAWVTDIYICPFQRGTGIPRHFIKAIHNRMPEIRGLYDVTERGNYRAEMYFKSQGAKTFDHFTFIGLNFKNDQ
jgi:hypothetical protein